METNQEDDYQEYDLNTLVGPTPYEINVKHDVDESSNVGVSDVPEESEEAAWVEGLGETHTKKVGGHRGKAYGAKQTAEVNSSACRPPIRRGPRPCVSACLTLANVRGIDAQASTQGRASTNKRPPIESSTLKKRSKYSSNNNSKSRCNKKTAEVNSLACRSPIRRGPRPSVSACLTLANARGIDAQTSTQWSASTKKLSLPASEHSSQKKARTECPPIAKFFENYASSSSSGSSSSSKENRLVIDCPSLDDFSGHDTQSSSQGIVSPDNRSPIESDAIVSPDSSPNESYKIASPDSSPLKDVSNQQDRRIKKNSPLKHLSFNQQDPRVEKKHKATLKNFFSNQWNKQTCRPLQPKNFFVGPKNKNTEVGASPAKTFNFTHGDIHKFPLPINFHLSAEDVDSDVNAVKQPPSVDWLNDKIWRPTAKFPPRINFYLNDEEVENDTNGVNRPASEYNRVKSECPSPSLINYYSNNEVENDTNGVNRPVSEYNRVKRKCQSPSRINGVPVADICPDREVMMANNLPPPRLLPAGGYNDVIDLIDSAEERLASLSGLFAVQQEYHLLFPEEYPMEEEVDRMRDSWTLDDFCDDFPNTHFSIDDDSILETFEMESSGFGNRE